MHLLRRALPLLAALTLPVALSAQSTLLVLSKADHTVAAVDPASLKVLWKAPVGDDPHEVIASTDGTRAYVSNYGSGSLHTIAVIDLKAHRALPSINLGNLGGPHGLTYVGGKLWFTAQVPGTVAALDPATGKVEINLPTHQERTHMVWVSENQHTIVATNVASGTVTIFEKSGASWTPTVVRVGDGSEGFDLSPDHKQVWVANAKPGTISVIDLAAKKVIATLDANVQGANRLQFTPNGKYVLVTSLSQPNLTVIDVATRKVVQHIPIGTGAAGLIVDASGSRAYASCTPDNYVAVIDLHTWKVVGHINAGGNPDGLAWAHIR